MRLLRSRQRSPFGNGLYYDSFKCRLPRQAILYASFPKPIGLLSTLIVPSKLHARMVNYHNPNTIAREFSAYAFPSGFGSPQLDLPIGPFNSGAREALARRRWYIYVSFALLPR